MGVAVASIQIRRSESVPLIGSKQRTSWKFLGLWRCVRENSMVCDARGGGCEVKSRGVLKARNYHEG